MKQKLILLLFTAMTAVITSCSSEEMIDTKEVTLSFVNTFGATEIVLGDALSTEATVHTSNHGQTHKFSELKYVVSNIRLIKSNGSEVPYFTNDLDKGAFVVDQSDLSSLKYVLQNIPTENYTQIKFGLGVRKELNVLDEERFPEFYRNAGENNTQMMWEWGTGYRFTKIEGVYGADLQTLSIHTGSTLESSDDDDSILVQGVDAYRDIVLDLPTTLSVGSGIATIYIQADFDHLLSGNSHSIVLTTGTSMSDNATPNVHTAMQMLKFVDNLGGDGVIDRQGMFSVLRVEN